MSAFANEREHGVDILQRVHEGRALCSADREPLLKLIEAEFMHVNPVHVPGEVCPYRLTDKGRGALRKIAREGLQPGQEAPAEPAPETDPAPPLEEATAPELEAAPPIEAPAPKPKRAKAEPKAKEAKPKGKADKVLAAAGERICCPDCAAEVCTVKKEVKAEGFTSVVMFSDWAQDKPSAMQGMPYRCKCGAAWLERKAGKLRLHVQGRGWATEGGKA